MSASTSFMDLTVADAVGLAGGLETGVLGVQKLKDLRPMVLVVKIDTVLLLHLNDDDVWNRCVLPPVFLHSLLGEIVIDILGMGKIQIMIYVLLMSNGDFVFISRPKPDPLACNWVVIKKQFH